MHVSLYSIYRHTDVVSEIKLNWFDLRLTKELLWGMSKTGVREVGWRSVGQVRPWGQDVVDAKKRGSATGGR